MLLLRIGTVALNLVVNLVIARSLGITGAGIFFLAFTVVRVSVALGALGVDHAVLGLLSKARAQADWAGLKGIVVIVLSAAIGIGALLSAVVAAGAGFAGDQLFNNPDVASPLRWIALCCLTHLVMLLVSQSLRSLKRTIAAELVQGLIPALLKIALIAVMASMFGVMGAIWGLFAASLVAAVAGVVLLWRSEPNTSGVRARIEVLPVYASAFPLFFVSLSDVFLNFAPNLIIGAFGPVEEVAIYNIAERLSALALMVLTAVDIIVAPRFAELHVNGDRERLRRVARQGAMLSAAASLPLIVGFYVLGQWLLGLFGPDFAPGWPVLMILAVGQTINACTGPVGYLLAMTGHERQARNINVTAVILTLGGLFVLVPEHGALGAAMAVATGTVLKNLWLSVEVRRRLGFWVLPATQ